MATDQKVGGSSPPGRATPAISAGNRSRSGGWTTPLAAGLLLLVALAAPALAASERILPDQPQSDLLAVVAASSAGDTVWVAPGEYGPIGSALRVPGGVRLIAETGPSSTVLAGTAWAVLDVGDPDSAAVLEGLTIDGLGAAEGGVHAEGARVTVRNCTVRGCWSGIRVIRGELRASATTVRGCANGIYLYESGGMVSDCEIAECTQGVTLVSAGPRIRRTTVRDNVTGIVVSEFSSPVLGGSVERANHVLGNVGAAVRNVSRARQTGLRGLQPLTLDLTYNFWGTDCPDSLMFLGPVTFAPWIDSAGRARSSCDGASAR